MSMDDLYKALAIFQDGMQKHAIMQAANEANAKVVEMNKNAMEESERQQVAAAISQELALRLTGAGANAAQIQAATDQIAPSAAAQAQFGLQEDQMAQTVNENQKDRDLKWAMLQEQIAGRKAQQSLMVDVKLQDKLAKLQEGFMKDKIVMKARTSEDTAKQLRDLTAEAKINPAVTPTIQRLLARASSDVGAMSDQDVAAFGGSPALKDWLNRMTSKAIKGTLPAQDLKYINQLTTVLENAAKGTLKKEALRYGKQHGKRFGVSPEYLSKELWPDMEEQKPGSPAGQQPPNIRINFKNYFEE